ncbi:MAG: aminotransferase class V-fold PLP-dependent enzyme, partial [Lachnospiraceae bacterium]|nr:aminotransferase class V-fold PLP-dependent enzyme [Lachnospiraceae bacterium]
MEAYLDNSATTRCFDEVTDLMVRVMKEDFGNPSSLHTKGMEAERYLRAAKAYFAENLKVREKEIYFTSGGTESNNLAIIGAAMANQRAGKHLITSRIEHPSVENPMQYLEGQGYVLTCLPVDEKGVVSLAALKEAVTEETILVSVMYVNNEIGSVQPIDEMARIIHEKNPRTLFHVDA